MGRRESNRSRRLPRLDPNSSRASKQRERVIANNLAWSGNIECYRARGKRTSAAKLVSNTHDDASGVDAVTNEFAIVCFKMKPLIGACS